MEKQEYILIKEASKIWGLTEKYIGVLCRHGMIPGAIKKGSRWYVPKNYDKYARPYQNKKLFEMSEEQKQ